MTLAALLLFAISSRASLSSGALPQSAAEPAAASQTTPEKQDQAPPPSHDSPAAAKPPASSPPTPQKPSAAKRPTHKKKAATANCDVLPTTDGSANSATPSKPSNSAPSDAAADPASGGNAALQPSETPPKPKPCPPQKIVVPHGGTSQPSIQLAGGPAKDQAARQRDVVNQLLGVTDRNLKGIAGRQLTSTQQDTVTQIRQFMDQSKAAVATGDLDRARTLAWKAELLSEDLTKPQK